MFFSPSIYHLIQFFFWTFPSVFTLFLPHFFNKTASIFGFEVDFYVFLKKIVNANTIVRTPFFYNFFCLPLALTLFRIPGSTFENWLLKLLTRNYSLKFSEIIFEIFWYFSQKLWEICFLRKVCTFFRRISFSFETFPRNFKQIFHKFLKGNFNRYLK